MTGLKTIPFVLLLTFSGFAQTQTTGAITGAVRDQQGALVAGATITIGNKQTGEERTTATDETGAFAVALLAPGTYQIRAEAAGFLPFTVETMTVSVAGSTLVDLVLAVAGPVTTPVIVDTEAPAVKTDNATLGQVFDGPRAADLPMATRNFTQLLILAPGTSAFLVDNTVVGRNTLNVSVNGARTSQNNFQINGIDANFGVNSARQVASPAPESVAEFRIQTSLYDATFGRAGGGNIQVVTRSGSNKFSGTIYDYFGNTALNANNPFLKAARQPRPVLDRNIFGLNLGGPIKRERAFFFLSYQTTRERNGASRLNSLSSNILIGTVETALTDDRTEIGLRNRFPTKLPIHSLSLALLNARLSNGQFLIPTPNLGSRYNGSAVSTFREEQFNANFDYRLTAKNLLSTKVFFARVVQRVVRTGNANVPGFPAEQDTDSLLVSIQDVHSFNSDMANEARIGMSRSVANDSADPAFVDTQTPYRITRSTSGEYPGFPIIRIAAAAEGVQFGTVALQYSEADILTPTFTDTISVKRGSHSIRTGFEFRYSMFNMNLPAQTRGVVAFQNFTDFLQGITQQSVLANGITERAFRAADYNPFIQDDWKVSRRLTLNLGLRYELDLPAYDTRGRIATFDASLYTPPSSTGLPGGLVQAGNTVAGYDVDGFANVRRRVLNSLDWNNLAPRVGLAFAPFDNRAFVMRAGYGVYYSRSALAYLVSNIIHPPFYYSNIVNNTIPRLANFSAPFPTNIPTQGQFPRLPSAPLSGIGFDRNIRTPYIQQFNASAQFAVFDATTLEIAYVGSRGINLFRQVGINQALLAVPGNPVNGITTNTTANAQARARFRGLTIGSGYLQDQSTAQSTYHSLQLNLTRRFLRGLQFQVSYTFASSIDNASGGGGGAGTNGLTDTGVNLDTASIIGDQLDNRANRGHSNFDRRHRFVSSFLWELPKLPFAKRSKAARVLFSGWQMAGIVTAMSGMPIDVIDSMAGSFYLGTNGGGGRPNFAPGATLQTATTNTPAGYYFNPYAFARPQVLNGQLIPSSNGATANGDGTDFGNVGRNILRGPRQFNADLSISKRFSLVDSKTVALRVDVFNLFNNVNFANPISNLNAVNQSGGLINTSTGEIVSNRAGDFGKIISTSNNPRLVQVVFKFHF